MNYNMYLNNMYIILILLISLSCNNSGWGEEGVGDAFTIKRHKSYNYSEMLSGDLDSTEKTEFDNYKEGLTEKKENELENKNTNVVKEKNYINEKYNTFLSTLYNFYRKFIGLFN